MERLFLLRAYRWRYTDHLADRSCRFVRGGWNPHHLYYTRPESNGRYNGDLTGSTISSGELSDQIYYDASDPNSLTLLYKWNSLANAQKFANAPELKVAMEKAGVVSEPNVHFLIEA
jgi:hypothetical protein